MLQGQTGFKMVLKNIIRENLFPKVKFIKKENDLLFDEDASSICGCILKWFNFERKQMNFKYKFWSANQDNVDKYFTQHRNNKIKKFKRQAKGKLIMLCINTYIFII